MLNDEPADFCAKCGGPLTAHAVNDPFDMIKSQGFMYRSASRSPQSLVVVIGVWVLMLPTFCYGIWILLMSFRALFTEDFHPLALLVLGVAGLFVWIPGTLMTRTLANYQTPGERRQTGLDEEENEEDLEEDGDEYWRIPSDETDNESSPDESHRADGR
jgi:hypothetical protein